MFSTFPRFLVLCLAPVTDGGGGSSDLPPELATSLSTPTPEPADATPADLPPADPTPSADDARPDVSGTVADTCADPAHEEPGNGHRCGVDGDADPFAVPDIKHEVTADVLVLVTADGEELGTIKVSFGAAVECPGNLAEFVAAFLDGARAGLRASIRGY